MLLRRGALLLVLLLVACQPSILAAPLPTLATFPP
jgi:hypothetical protein